MTLQNQKVADEKYNIVQQYCNSQTTSTCCEKSDGLSYIELRAVLSVQIGDHQGGNWSGKKRELDISQL